MAQHVWGAHNNKTDFDPIAQGCVGVSYRFPVDLRSFASKDALRDAYSEWFPAKTAYESGQVIGVLYRFSRQAQVGDVVVLSNRENKTLSIGVVTGPYYFEEQGPTAPHRLPVEWKHVDIPRANLSQSTLNTLGSGMSFFEVRNGRQEILDLLRGVNPATKQPVFDWVPFYEQLANTVLTYRTSRAELLDKVLECGTVSGKPDLFKFLLPSNERYSDGTRVRDIDPFTVFAPFNRSIIDANRLRIAEAYKQVFGIEAPAPTGFSGVPLLNNLNSWFMHFPAKDADDSESNVEQLWDLAEAAIRYADSGTDADEEAFVATFDAARRNSVVQITMGLFYLRPRKFVAVDSQNVRYLNEQYPNPETLNLNRAMTGDEYVATLDSVTDWISESAESPSTIVELSHEAFVHRVEPATIIEDEPAAESTDNSYDVSQIIDDGCFLEEAQLTSMLHSLEAKKNLILQGPPGTGKTWLARRLAYALIGEKNTDSLTVMQFHPSMSYEDFVRGYRPSPTGSLELIDGPLLTLAERARADQDTRYVMIIEEINRGNPAQIFGEMLTLMENTKRVPAAAMQLIYPRTDEQFYLPPNLYIIGTMNLADRSLALVDMAFRRRFAFTNLYPQINNRWLEYVTQLGYDASIADAYRAALADLNQDIHDDQLLGPEYQIGHSYIVPTERIDTQANVDAPAKTRAWLQVVTDTEILPLLEEYWFDNHDKVAKAKSQLTAALHAGSVQA
ncbi:AAA family ATPase [Corynebacterium sp. UMB8791]